MNILPWLAFLAAAAATVLGALHIAGKGQQWRVWQVRALIVATGVAAAVLIVLLVLFLLADVGTEYVFLYTRTDVPLRYRIAGVWAGREGSLALWAFYAIAIATWWSRRRTAASSDRSDAWTLLGLSALAAGFLGGVAASDLFTPTSDFLLQQRPEGNGLNPTLQSDFFLIHPPMMFLAYALTNVPAAAAMAHLVTGEGRWSAQATAPARLNWLLYTAAMGLGGVWAYYTLGFGGYWAWDPVEVANLLPWLALTLYLHVQLQHRRHGNYRGIGPFMAMLPFWLTLFSTISTRSGLWISVHAFTDPTQTFNPDAVGRFQDILAVEASLAFYVGLLMGTAALFLAFWARRLAPDSRGGRMAAGLFGAFAAWSFLAPASAYSALASTGDLLTAGRTATGMLAVLVAAVLAAAWPLLRGSGDRMRLDLRGLAYIAILVLGLSLLVLWLWHMLAANGWSRTFYEDRLPILAAPAVAALMVFMALPHGRRRALWITGSCMAGAGVAGLIARDGGVFLLAAAIVFALLAADRVRRATGAAMGPSLLALGALLDVVFWINPPSTLLGAIDVGWPIHLLALPAVVALQRSLRHMAGDARGLPQTRWMVGLLGGFYIAPFLAAAARRSTARFHVAKMRQVGLYLVHFAVAVALVGYATSTYLGSQQEMDLQVGAAQDGVTFTEGAMHGDPVQAYTVRLEAAGPVVATLEWEPLTGSYYPYPGTHRSWHGDTFLALDSVCLDACGPGDRITAYEPTFQRGHVGEVTNAAFTIHALPGLALVWAALLLFLHGMVLLMREPAGGAKTGRNGTANAVEGEEE